MIDKVYYGLCCSSVVAPAMPIVDPFPCLVAAYFPVSNFNEQQHHRQWQNVIEEREKKNPSPNGIFLHMAGYR